MTMKLKLPKTINIALPLDKGREIQAVAKQERRTVTDVIWDSFNRYQAKKELYELASKARKAVKRKGLTPKDFGGPFAE